MREENFGNTITDKDQCVIMIKIFYFDNAIDLIKRLK
jgi:hypothetical protein